MTGPNAQALYKQRQLLEDPDAWRAARSKVQAVFRSRHPEKKAAWNAVYTAVKSGRLVRPDACERCETPCHPEASHDDYTKRLDVEWLCKLCHAAKDRDLRST